MVSSYTPNLRLTKQGDNDNPNTWGQIVNTQVITLIEEAVSGVSTIDITGVVDVDISATVVNGGTDQARHATLLLQGLLGNSINLIVPSVDKQYIIHGTHSGYTVNVKPAGGSTPITVAVGEICQCYVHGTVITKVTPPAPDVSGKMDKSANLSDVQSIPTALNNLGVTSVGTTSITALLATIYPVGTLYWNATNSTSPATLFGFGTWQAITDRFILAAGSTYTAGNTGGAAQTVLSSNQIPSLSGTGTTTSVSGQHTSGGSVYNIPMSGPATTDTYSISFNTAGGSTPVPTIPPYLVSYCWERIA